jgi:hypothetical protein
MRIGLDVDGVFADFVWGFTYEATKQHVGTYPYSTRKQKNWNFPFVQPIKSATWTYIKSIPNWWMTLESLVTLEEIRVVNEIIQKHDVYFITSRPRGKGLTAELQTRYWLESIGVNTNPASVISTKTGTKPALCDALDLHLMVEDSPEVLRALQECWDADYQARPIARRWAYNEEIIRALDLDYIENLISLLVILKKW